MLRSMASGRFTVPCGMSEFPLRSCGFILVLTKDRYDEGTAFMPVVTQKNRLPLPVRDQYRFLAPDVDLPSDWYCNFLHPETHVVDPTCRYMRICGMTVETLRGERSLLEAFPQQELYDYWRTHPRYEDGSIGGHVPPNSSTKGSESGLAQMMAVEENSDEPPPPPYTLEADDDAPAQSSLTQDGFETAPTSPTDHRGYHPSDLATDLGRHTLRTPSPQSPQQPFPGGFDSRPTSPSYANTSHTARPPSPAFANRPTSKPRPAPPEPSYFVPPSGSSEVSMPSVAFPNPNMYSKQPVSGFNVGAPADPWVPSPQHAPPIHVATQSMMLPQPVHEGAGLMTPSTSGYGPPFPSSQSMYPGPSTSGQIPSPTHSPFPGQGYQQQYPYPGQTSYGPLPPQGYGQDESAYPGMMGSLTSRPPDHSPTLPSPGSPPLPQGHGQHQFPFPGMTNTPAPTSSQRPPTRPPMSNSPPLSQGYGQQQSSYPDMANTPAPGPPDRPPTRPMSNSPPSPQSYGQHQSYYPGMTSVPSQAPPERPPTRPPTSSSPSSQGYGQHQSTYPGMTSSPPPTPVRPPTSHASRPNTPYNQSSMPPQSQPPPLPGRYDHSSGSMQPGYGGMNPGAMPPQNGAYQPPGPGPYGYQPPPPGVSPYPGYPESEFQPPPLPPRECDACSKLPFVCFMKLKKSYDPPSWECPQ